MTTPDWHSDLRAYLAALKPADFPLVDIFIGKELQTGGAFGGIAVGEQATFIKLVDTQSEDYDETGEVQQPTFQVKHRTDRSRDPDGSLALARMVGLYDAIRQNAGGFTGASGAVYVDIVPRTFPMLLEETYVVMDVVLWRDEPHE